MFSCLSSCGRLRGASTDRFASKRDGLRMAASNGSTSRTTSPASFASARLRHHGCRPGDQRLFRFASPRAHALVAFDLLTLSHPLIFSRAKMQLEVGILMRRVS